MKKLLTATIIISFFLFTACRKNKKELDDFKTEMDAAMSKMMTDMKSVSMSTDPDVDFARMMIPHHQGAIDMSNVILKYSNHTGLADMATKTKTENEQSISRLNQYLNSHGSPVPMSNGSFMDEMDMAMDKMDKTMMAAHFTVDPDHDFAQQMIHHHQGAIDMSKIELKYGTDSLIRGEAQMIIDKQELEIIELAKFLNEHGEPEKIGKHNK